METIESLQNIVEVDCCVTEEHIRDGIPKNPEFCPVALSLKEKVRDDRILVFISNRLFIMDLRLLYAREHFEYATKLPDEVRTFQRRFDVGSSVEPTSFTFRIPKPFLN